MPDQDGYPTRKELNIIKNWDMNNGWGNLAKYVQSIWYWGSDYALFVAEKDHNFQLHTGGWSGNEEIIEALRKNKDFFWIFCWIESRRGGHYKFRVYGFKE